MGLICKFIWEVLCASIAYSSCCGKLPTIKNPEKKKTELDLKERIKKYI